MADNTLLSSKYIQLILESSLEIADILDPENAPHSTPEPETEQQDEVFPIDENQEQETQEETNNQTEGTEGDATGETGEPEVIVHDYTQRIFPLLQPDTLAFPYIVHSRTGIVVEYTKDVHFGFGWTNTINYTVKCASDDYVQCIELANAVRHALEGTRYRDDDIFIHPIKLLSVAEYTTDDDAFVEELIFTFDAE